MVDHVAGARVPEVLPVDEHGDSMYRPVSISLQLTESQPEPICGGIINSFAGSERHNKWGILSKLAAAGVAS